LSSDGLNEIPYYLGRCRKTDEYMKVALLVYEGFVEFEISLLLLLLRNKCSLSVISADDLVVTSFGRLTVQADFRIGELESIDFSMVVIPGGEPRSYAGRSDIKSFIKQAYDAGIPIAAICGGPEFLVQAGILQGKRITHGHDPAYAERVFSECMIENADVVIDGSIITARGQAYAEFAIEVYDYLGLFESPSEKDETLRWMKNIT